MVQEDKNNKDLMEEILDLKKKRNAVILAHNYQRLEVQSIGDYLGDSLDLSRKAALTDADVIVFCGVYFMAESAKILNPGKTVLLPELEAGCFLAEKADPGSLIEARRKHPDAAVVTYINSTAEIKALSDICCTSANALKVVESMQQTEVIMLPDKNLASWVEKQTTKKIIKWDGYCYVHDRVKAADIEKIKRAAPAAIVIAHPECREEVLELADYVVGTTGMVKLAGELDAEEMIIVTEVGLVDRLSVEFPSKRFYAIEKMVCRQMKLTTLVSVRDALRDMKNIITVDEDIRLRAFTALDRMLKL